MSDEQWWDYQGVDECWMQGADYFGPPSFFSICRGEVVETKPGYWGWAGPEPPEYDLQEVEEIRVRPIIRWYGRGLSLTGGDKNVE